MFIRATTALAVSSDIKSLDVHDTNTSLALREESPVCHAHHANRTLANCMTMIGWVKTLDGCRKTVKIRTIRFWM